MTVAGSATMYAINGDGSVTQNSDYNLSGGQSMSFTDVNCISTVHNATYDTTWGDIAHFPDTGVVPPYKTPSCSPMDFACWLSPIFSGIGDGFNNVIQALTQGIATLFVPSQNLFSDTFTTLSTFFQTKFGFLVYPFTFIPNLFNALTSYDNIDSCAYGGGGSIGVPGVCNPDLGTFYGSNVTINFGALEQTFPTLWTLIRTFISGITVFTLALAFRRKYMEVVKS